MEKEIRSRFSIWFVSTLLAIGGSCVIGFVATLNYILSSSHKKEIAVFVFLIFLLVIPILIVRHIALYFPVITFHKHGVRFKYLFKNANLQWNDILSISLTGQESLSDVFANMNYDYALVISKSKRKYRIIYKHYSNYVTLLKLLEQASFLKKNRLVEQTIQLAHFSGKSTNRKYPNFIFGQKYSGSILNYFSFYAFLSGGCFILFFSIPLYLETFDWIFLFFSLAVAAGIYVVLGRRYYYFVLSDEYLVFKNPLFFWVRKVYALEDIRELVVEQPHKSPVQLKVINSDFLLTQFPCETISSETWLRFEKDLKRKKIKLRKETYFF